MMSADQTPLMSGAQELLHGQRARSYGSVVTSSQSPIRRKCIQHQVQPGETLQGLSLKYGVSMEQIKRANRLYTNDSIFLKKILLIPVLTDPLSFTNDDEVHNEKSSHLYEQVPAENGPITSGGPEVTADISPSDYLKRMDGLIYQSKQAAVKTCQERDKLFSSADQDQHRHQESGSSCQSQAIMGLVPLTITKRTKKLRDKEDEIFQL